ncbi:MAG: hypothetical protein KGL39_07230 [Patescibacteria group bacterium]|nr:hypothetical protein [Patescibacteria group bacterium]
MTKVSYRAAELIEAISRMLEERACEGNAQSKHGPDAAYDYECARFVAALDELLSKASP